MSEHETAAKLALLKEQENAEIVRNYEKAFATGVRDWAEDGGRGSMFAFIKAQMIEKGVINDKH
jgi:hypothetical protein